MSVIQILLWFLFSEDLAEHSNLTVIAAIPDSSPDAVAALMSGMRMMMMMMMITMVETVIIIMTIMIVMIMIMMVVVIIMMEMEMKT
jgi:hypothetical protein